MSISTCSRFLKAGFLMATALLSGSAFAQKAGGAPPRSRNQPLNLSSSDASASTAQRARAKAKAGECEAALPLFDEAIRITIEPTLRRDRGACHDKLGNATAAIEDYRAYLYARPEAQDAKEIEERIQVLDGQLEAARKPEDTKSGGGAEASASISINGEKAEAKGSTKGGSGDASDDKAATSYDDFSARVKRRDEAESSSIRSGSGGAFGFYLSFRGFATKGFADELSYAVGVTPRYSFNSFFGIVGELGFAGVGTRPRTAVGGVQVWAAPEIRLKLDPYASNQILLALGPGFERYSGLDRSNSAAFNTFHLRGRVGFRHVFGANVALDASFDPAVMFAKYDGDPQVVSVGGQAIAVTPQIDPQFLVGGTLSLVVGF